MIVEHARQNKGVLYDRIIIKYYTIGDKFWWQEIDAILSVFFRRTVFLRPQSLPFKVGK